MSLIAVVFSAIIVVMMAAKIKEYDQGYGVVMSVAGCVMVLCFVTGRLSRVTYYIERLTSYLTTNVAYIDVILKMIGVAYICQFSADICKDAGYGAMAFQVEMAGKISLILLGMPVLMSVIDLVVSLLED